MYHPSPRILACISFGFLTVLCAHADRPVIDAGPMIDPARPGVGIQKAINQASETPGGAIVKLPAGTFALRRGLVLKSNVELVGAGMDKTILTVARRPVAVKANGFQLDGETATVAVESIPEGLEPGLVATVTATMPPGHGLTKREVEVLTIDPGGTLVTVRSPNGKPSGKIAPDGQSVMLFGQQYLPAGAVTEGATGIELKNAKGIEPGDELTLGTPENDSMPSHVFVKEVKGNTVVLEEPAATNFPKPPGKKKPEDEGAKEKSERNFPVIWAVFPLVHGHHIMDAAVRDLTIKGYADEGPIPCFQRYTVGGIHLYDSKVVTLERVAVRNWHTDGFSIQNAADDRIVACEATDNAGHGLHPGTKTERVVFDGNLSKNNTGDGLYFCWHNCNMTLTGNKFVGNGKNGMGGLGNPGERNNLIEKNLIADNGQSGIGINGGGRSGNVIRDNVIENNSKKKPGEFPGIRLRAGSDPAELYTITGNTIRDTQKSPTQFVGVEESNGVRFGTPLFADNNTIEGNTFAGHSTADVVHVGKSTVVSGGGKFVQGPDFPPGAPAVGEKKAGGKKEPAKPEEE